MPHIKVRNHLADFSRGLSGRLARVAGRGMVSSTKRVWPLASGLPTVMGMDTDTVVGT